MKVTRKQLRVYKTWGKLDRETVRYKGRAKNPLHLEPILFRVGNYAVIGLGQSIFLAPRLRKAYSDTFTAILGNYGLLYFENNLLPARRVRRSLLQYIQCRSPMVEIAVLIADISGRTVLRQWVSVFVRDIHIDQTAKYTNIWTHCALMMTDFHLVWQVI